MQSDLQNERRFYVYAHYLVGDTKPFYIGKGTGNRFVSKSRRSKSWHETVKNKGWISEILHKNLTEQEALLIEEEEIYWYNVSIVNVVTRKQDRDQIDFSNVFYYDETSPSCLRWKIDNKPFRCPLKNKKDSVAGNLSNNKENNKKKYWVVMYNKRHYLVHRIVYELLKGKIEKQLVLDHLDGNSLNNKISNLCIKTMCHNNRNRSIVKSNTGVLGVSRCCPKGRNTIVYFANWRDKHGKSCTKSFSVTDNRSEEETFRLACEYRVKMLKEMNSAGANYSDMHLDLSSYKTTESNPEEK